METAQQKFISMRKQYIENRFGQLNDMQRQAVFTTKGPLLILAGAGSGKTTVLVNRIANLILFGDAYHSDHVKAEVKQEQLQELKQCIAGKTDPSAALAPLLGVDAVRPWNVLAITFTNKAAGELKERLTKVLGPQTGGSVNASTFHAACVRMLRRDAESLGFPKSFTIYDSDDQMRVIKDLYKSMNVDDKFLAPRACLSAIGRLKDTMKNPVQAEQTATDTRAKLVAQVYAAYAKRCKSAGAMDFDDLIYYTVRLLQESEEVRAFYKARFKYVLVDEYQDTSVAQFMLVNLLCDENNNVCVVGDDDQSIYRFRGATIENILSFEQRFAGARVIRLEQNYRSTSSILNAANSVIENNAGRKGKTLWTDNGEGELVEHYCAESESDEAAHIAEVIGENLKKGAKLCDHAVLYRMNAQSSPVENYFTRAGIPYKIVGGQRFNDRKEIRDLHAYLSVLANPLDDLRLRRIINEPARKIGATTVAKVAEIAQGLGATMLEIVQAADAYPLLARASNALQGFYEIYKKLVHAWETLPLEEFAAELPKITGYEAMLHAQGEEGLTRLENIGQLVSNIKTYADMNGEDATLAGYLEEIALISDIDSYDESADYVVMMTLHSAKGLEFPYVFIVGMEEGIFPSDMSKWSEEDIAEERRLCYVGITRAKKELVLSSAASRMLYGQTRRNPQSRFLEEIKPEVINRRESPNLAPQRFAGAAAGFGGGTIAFGGGSAAAAGAAKSGYLDNNYNRKPPAATGAFGASVPATAKPKYRSSAPMAPKGNAGVVFAAGDKIEHKVFGQGVVQKVTPVAGDSLVEILFDTHGKKKTMANFAPLKKI